MAVALDLAGDPVDLTAALCDEAADGCDAALPLLETIQAAGTLGEDLSESIAFYRTLADALRERARRFRSGPGPDGRYLDHALTNVVFDMETDQPNPASAD